MENNYSLQNWYSLEEVTWDSCEEVGLGIWVYRNVLKKDMNIIEILENTLSNNPYGIKWEEAMVGHYQKMPEYRDCYDFKYKNINEGFVPEFLKSFDDLYKKTYYAQLQAVKDYCKKYNIGELKYWETTNFVKYENNQHFQYHSDHGFSYNCTLSMVSYPNDNYEGGELEFKIQGIKIKPKAGDTFLFPSNYMYPHRSCPVKNGVKYSLVTMLDYSEYFHTPEFYRSIAEENSK